MQDSPNKKSSFFSSIGAFFLALFAPILAVIRGSTKDNTDLPHISPLESGAPRLVSGAANIKEPAKAAPLKPPVPKPEIVVRMMLIGDDGVGKKTIIDTFANTKVNDTTMINEATPKEPMVLGDGSTIKLMLRSYNSITPNANANFTKAKNSNIVGIVFDVTDKESFEHVKTHVAEIQLSSNARLVLIGNNKQKGERAVTQEEAKNLADSYGIKYQELDATKPESVNTAFKAIAQEAVEEKRSLTLS
jgi:Ras-related protein Rab-1A